MQKGAGHVSFWRRRMKTQLPMYGTHGGAAIRTSSSAKTIKVSSVVNVNHAARLVSQIMHASGFKDTEQHTMFLQLH